MVKKIYNDGTAVTYLDTESKSIIQQKADLDQKLKDKVITQEQYDKDLKKINQGHKLVPSDWDPNSKDNKDRYIEIDSIQRNQLPGYFEPTTDAKLQITKLATNVRESAMKGDIKVEDAETVLRDNIITHINQNLKGIDLLSAMVDWEGPNGNSFVNSKANKEIQKRWEETLNNLPREERAKYNKDWFKNTTVPPEFTNEDGSRFNVIATARRELGEFLADKFIPGLGPALENEKALKDMSTVLNTGLNLGYEKGAQHINVAKGMYIDVKMNDSFSTPEELINKTNTNKDPNAPALTGDQVVQEGDVLVNNVESTIKSVLGYEGSNMIFTVADGNVKFPTIPGTSGQGSGRSFKSIDEMRSYYMKTGDVQGYNNAIAAWQESVERNNSNKYATKDNMGKTIEYPNYQKFKGGQTIILAVAPEMQNYTDVQSVAEGEEDLSPESRTQKFSGQKFITYTIPSDGTFSMEDIKTWVSSNVASNMNEETIPPGMLLEYEKHKVIQPNPYVIGSGGDNNNTNNDSPLNKPN